MPALILDKIQKQFPTPDKPVVVLRDIDLRMENGQSLAIVGPSGSGKSTLLHLIGTLDRPTAGQLTLDGRDLLAMNPQALADFRNLQLGFVFQEHYLLPQLTAFENVLIPALARGRPQFDVTARALELLQKLGLEHRQSHRPAELSGGERQRVALARALLHRPRLLLADEPTGNLDHETARAMGQLLLQMQQQHAEMILIVVTHSLELARQMHRCLQLDNGKLA